MILIDSGKPGEAFLLRDHDTVYVPMEKANPPVLNDRVTLVVAEDGALTLAGGSCPQGELMRRLKIWNERHPVEVRIQASTNVPLGHVMTVENACREAGITIVQLATVQAGEQVEKEAFAFRLVASDAGGSEPVDLLVSSDDPAGNLTLRVERQVVLSEVDIAEAKVSKSAQGDSEIQVNLTEEGKRRFADATAAKINRQLAIVWNGQVVSAPVIRQAIAGGTLVIQGRFSDAEATKLAAVLDHSISTANPPRTNPLPVQNLSFGGVDWQPWRTLFEVRDGELVSLPKARPGFNYGHWGQGRGPEVITNVGNTDWKDYRVDADFCARGVDAAFNPHGLGLDYHGAMIAFHIANAKESWNESGTSAYILGMGGEGDWSLTAYYNNYCRVPNGWGNNRSDAERRLASGNGLPLDRIKGNHFRIEVRGKRIQIWVDDIALVDVVDEHMDDSIGGQMIDHGGVAFIGGFDAMIRLRNVSIIQLDAASGEMLSTPIRKSHFRSVHG